MPSTRKLPPVKKEVLVALVLLSLVVSSARDTSVSSGEIVVEASQGEDKFVAVYTPGPVDSTYEIWVTNLQNSTGSFNLTIDYSGDTLLNTSSPLENLSLAPGESIWTNFRSNLNCSDCIKITGVTISSNSTVWARIKVIPHVKNAPFDSVQLMIITFIVVGGTTMLAIILVTVLLIQKFVRKTW